jgi:putative Ca2+/H+ antiporter (TMEM165/GDT1 family)
MATTSSTTPATPAAVKVPPTRSGTTFVMIFPAELPDKSLFAGGSVLVLLAKQEDEGEAGEAPVAVADQRPARVAFASFGVVFLGEWGDITQITTANLTARYHDPLSVGAGALLALWSVTALALTAGRGLVQRLPTRLVRRFTAVVLALLAVGTLVEAVRV